MNTLRYVHARRDGRHVVTFDWQVFHHPALDSLPVGTPVFVTRRAPETAPGAFRICVWRADQRRSGTPFCVATPAPRLDAVDPDQLTLVAPPALAA
jgi:hypothetical protein